MNRANGIETPALRIRYDPDADAMYFRLRDGTVDETVEIEQMVYVDLDAGGRPLGVEFVVASDFLAFLARRAGEFVLPARIEAGADALAP
jgi:uncharacterized protein YuzE